MGAARKRGHAMTGQGLARRSPFENTGAVRLGHNPKQMPFPPTMSRPPRSPLNVLHGHYGWRVGFMEAGGRGLYERKARAHPLSNQTNKKTDYLTGQALPGPLTCQDGAWCAGM